MPPFFAITIILVCLGTILGISTWGAKSNKLSGESARKLVHVGMGVICLSFPYLFDRVFPVQILALLAIGSLLIVRTTYLRASVGSGLFSVKRLSIGELLFPAAVAWIFTLSIDQPVLYYIAILQLTLADTAGALAGSRWGRQKYQSPASTKSVEGSIAFFITAFLCTLAPLYLSPYFPELSSVLVLSLVIALFATVVEGMSGHGLDNLFIPLGTYLLLDYYLQLESEAIVIRVVALALLLGLLLSTHKLHKLNGGALLGASLFGFAAFTMGGWLCLAATLLLLVRHIYAQWKLPTELQHKHHMGIVAGVAIPTLTWVTLGRGEWLSPEDAQFGFISTLALTISMLHGGTRKHLGSPGPTYLKPLVLSLAILACALPIYTHYLHYLPPLILSLALCSAYFHWRAPHAPDDNPSNDWIKLCLLGLLGSSFVMLSTSLLP